MSEEQHQCEWLDRGQRQVRNCPECKATQIRSLADGRWYAYISGDEVKELTDLRTQLAEALSQRQAAEAQYNELHQHTMHTLAYVISKVAEAAIVGQGPYTALQFHEFTLNGIDKLAAQRQAAVEEREDLQGQRDELHHRLEAAVEEAERLRGELAAANAVLQRLDEDYQETEDGCAAMPFAISPADRERHAWIKAHRLASQPPAEAEGAS